jgi:hypothetical protein
MNLNGIKKALPYLFRNKIAGNIIGGHGLGKSTAVREYAQEQGIGFIDLRLGQMEVGDLLGLPEITNDKDGNKVTVFARPKWFPTEGRGILFLDELNRSKRDVIQAVFQLVLDRKLHDYTLPEGWQVISAMNPSTDDYQTLDLSDKAFNDRFCHIKVTSSYQDFVDYGTEKSFNKTVLNFISNHPGMLRGKTQDFTLNMVEPSDRSWEMVSRLANDKEMPEDILNELVTGIVGIEAAVAFMAWKKTAEKPIDGEVILKNYPKVQDLVKQQSDAKSYRSDLLNDTMKQVMDIIAKKKEKDKELTTKEYDNLVAFMIDLPNDLFTEFCRQTFKVPKFFAQLAEDVRLNPKIEASLADKKKTGTETANVTNEVKE